MEKIYLIALMLIAAMFLTNFISAQAVGPITRGNQTYYVVNSLNPSLNTGNAVCASVGLQCVGYTRFSTDVCQQVNPTANVIASENGSKSGYYCNGPPSSGECSNKYNTCDICADCGINADCSSTIGGDGEGYAQMYVQCAANATLAARQLNQTQTATTTIAYTYHTTTSFFTSFTTFFSNFFSGFTSFFGNIFGHTQQTNTTHVQLIGPYSGYWGCTFFQYPWHGVNQKKVDCNVYKAADSFCATVLESPYATAAYCNETSGLVVCINPCNKGGQVMPTSCPYDAARPNGAQAAPQNWCG